MTKGLWSLKGKGLPPLVPCSRKNETYGKRVDLPEASHCICEGWGESRSVYGRHLCPLSLGIRKGGKGEVLNNPPEFAVEEDQAFFQLPLPGLRIDPLASDFS